MSNLNINQFQQVTVRGDLDLQISKSGVITGQIASGQATALHGGDFIKLDTSNTGPVPQFLAAGVDDAAFGTIKRNVKQDTFSAGDYTEVAGPYGPVMWLVAGATIAPQAFVEDNGDGTVVTKNSHSSRGIALDPGTTGNLLRIVLTNPLSA